MDINTKNLSTPRINNMLYSPVATSPAEPDVPPVTPIYPSSQTPVPQPGRRGWGFWGWLLAGLALIALIAGLVIFTNRSSTSSKLLSLQSQVESLEQTAKKGGFSQGDQNTLDSLQIDIKKLEAKTTNLPEDSKTQLDDLTKRLDTLENSVGTPGPKGATGATGAAGATGAKGDIGDTGATGAAGATGSQGSEGVAGSNDCISGVCVSRQATTPGTAETGNINVSGTVIAGNFGGSGSGITNVDAAYLNGFNAGYFTNATNIASGTLANGRLSAQVTLQGNTFNGVSQLVQLTAGGILPVLSGSNLTNLTGANVTGNISGNAGTATALAANPTDCGANTYATTIAASGNLTCASITDASLSASVSLLGQTISNAELENSSLTINSSTGLSGGGAVSLGGTLTLTNSGVLSVIGTTNQITVSSATGNVTFNLPQDIAVTSSPTFANLTITTNLTTATLTTATLTYGTSITSSCSGLTGYIWIPGNPKFGTMPGFCVMKYEASNSAGTAVSVPGVAPWVFISQQTAQTTAAAACTGCHLISEAEWMTIATNALWINANWCALDGSACNNAPGTASTYLASGHNDNSPAAALAASATDSEACYGTVTAGVNDTCGSAGTQKRTLTLSNGNIIWDIPGDVWEWTDAWIIGNEQPNDAVDGFAYHEFTAITKWKDLNYANPTNRGWNSTQRLGQIYTDGTATNNTLYGFTRGGNWNSGTNAGAFTLALSSAPSYTSTNLGFRVAR